MGGGRRVAPILEMVASGGRVKWRVLKDSRAIPVPYTAGDHRNSDNDYIFSNNGICTNNYNAV